MNKKKVLQELSEFISIPSVSADPSRSSEMLRAVEFLKKELEELGCKVEVLDGENKPPLVLGILTVSKPTHTIGIYGHYDVQHEDPVSEWDTDPYTMNIKSGKIYGRGIADNKGHIIQNIAAIRELKAKNELKNNIVFFFEGEEETGSERFEELIKKKSDIFNSLDVCFITDVGMYAKRVPQILYALRGLVYFELEVVIGEKDLHSGVYGNSVYNPAHIVSEVMSKMKDVKTGEVLVEGFYDNVRTLDKEEVALLQKYELSDSEIIRDAQVRSVTSLKGYSAYLNSMILPSLDINGMDSGYIGEGPKTIIPRSARVKFSCRLVEHQDPEKVQKLMEDFIKKNIPKGVEYTLKIYSLDYPFYTSLEDPFIQKTAGILSTYFKTETVFSRSGGSIPAAEIIQRVYKKPIILTGFTLNDDNIHAPNENFDEEMFWEGIEAFKKIYSEI